MKNKGFTLIELLITITLITVISIAAGVGINQMFTRQRDTNYKQFVNTIENAGCAYAEINNIESNSTVSIGTLINEGLLSKKLSNPMDKQNIMNLTSKIVIITMDSSTGERKCTLE